MKKSHSDEFKFKVALEACLNKSTISELSKKFNGLAPSLIQKLPEQLGHLIPLAEQYLR